MKKKEILRIVRNAFDEHTVDVELWDELDKMDDGDTVKVEITVMDMKQIRTLMS